MKNVWEFYTFRLENSRCRIIEQVLQCLDCFGQSRLRIRQKFRDWSNIRAFSTTTVRKIEWSHHLGLTHPEWTLLLAIDELSELSVPSFGRIESNHRAEHVTPDLVEFLALF